MESNIDGALPQIANHKFDLILLISVLEHLEEPVRILIDPPVRELLALEDERCCARRAGRLAFEGSMNVEISWIIGGRVVPLHHGLFSFPIIHERYPRHQLVRVLEDGIHQVAEVIGESTRMQTGWRSFW